jgi:hypothetical protein
MAYSAFRSSQHPFYGEDVQVHGVRGKVQNGRKDLQKRNVAITCFSRVETTRVHTYVANTNSLFSQYNSNHGRLRHHMPVRIGHGTLRI